MKISKILDNNFMKNPRIESVENRKFGVSFQIFKYTLVDWKPGKLLICKFSTHRVVGSKLAL